MLGLRLWRQISRQAEHILENPAHRRIIGRVAPPLPFALECAMLLLVPLIMLPALLFTTAVYGMRWTMLISQSIARERTSGRFDLLALIPNGAFGSAWILACGAIQRTGMLTVLETPFAWLLRAFLMLVAFTTFEGFAVNNPLASQPDAILSAIFTFILLILALLVDHAHSVGLATLIGLLAPTYTTRTADAGLLALTVYTALQLTTYAITGIIGFALLPDIFAALNAPLPLTVLLLPILRVTILYSLREVIILYLWTLVQQQYNAAKQDVHAVDLPATTAGAI
jgi:hypothetical protein